MNVKSYAREAFIEVDKTLGKRKHENFIKEYTKLYNAKIAEEKKNDVGCGLSNDCSRLGCYRYGICNFAEKKVSD